MKPVINKRQNRNTVRANVRQAKSELNRVILNTGSVIILAISAICGLAYVTNDIVTKMTASKDFVQAPKSSGMIISLPLQTTTMPSVEVTVKSADK